MANPFDPWSLRRQPTAHPVLPSLFYLAPSRHVCSFGARDGARPAARGAAPFRLAVRRQRAGG
ncbi:MAG TPA: hypothetical protein VED20_08295, partial [Streptosporangiaceae bacterium]|nr:hypothetical protein [Streptosporangiaceae bacterium]